MYNFINMKNKNRQKQSMLMAVRIVFTPQWSPTFWAPRTGTPMRI